MKKKSITKMIGPIAALVAIVAQSYGFDVIPGDVETVLTAGLAIVVGFGVFANNDAKESK